jgi:serine phosphatase RsbU (regulator of sigma subunit)
LLIAHVRFEQHVRAKPEDAASTRKLLMKALGRANAPPVRNRPVFVCHVHAIRAALARHEGNLAGAKSLLERAQEQATISDNLWMRWYIDRERARIAHAENDAAGAERHAKAALTLARTHGWQNRIQQIEREFSVTVDAAAMSRSSLSTTFQVSSSRRLLEVERHMEALLQVSLASSSSLDPVEQAQAALDELVRVLGAERGFLFLNDGAGDAKGSTVRMLAARDAAGKDLPASSGYATTVVEKVNETLAPVVITGTQEGEVLGSESAVALNLRSIIAVPLLVRNELIGAVYLDSSLAKGLFTTDHLKILVPISNQVAIALRVSASARIEAQHLALEKELALTAAVQTLFLPKESSTKTAKLGLAGFYRPAMHCSGDWWYWYRRPNGALRVLLGDVTGHGAASAMVAATVATTFELLRDRGEDSDVPRVLGTLHQRLKRSAAQMTMSVVEVDALGTTIRWWNAGAPPLLVMSREGTTEVVRSKGTPLGSAHELLIGQKERPLHAGDRVFVFTDGLYEMMTPGERQLGMRRLQGSFQDTRKVEVASATSTLMTTLDGLRQGVPQDDDMTFAMLDVL